MALKGWLIMINPIQAIIILIIFYIFSTCAATFVADTRTEERKLILFISFLFFVFFVIGVIAINALEVFIIITTWFVFN